MVFFKAAIIKAESGIGFPFPCPVTSFLGNDDVFVVVLYCSLEFFKAVISKAEIFIGFAFACPVTKK